MKRGLTLAGLLFAAMLIAPGAAQARTVERIFRGKVIITLKRAPAHFRSQNAFVRFLRANNKKHIWPTKTNKKQWKFEFMAFFTQALDDLEVKIKFYDVTDIKKFVAADSFYTPSRGQKILASNMVLEQPRFAVNRKYLMQVMSPRGRLLASTSFWLRGQKEVYSGRVTFTDEETRIKD